MPLLEAIDISKSYSGVRALRNVSFDLLPGEVHALVGENGAGKSTLIKVVTGAVAPDSGTLRIAGRLVENHNPVQAHALGIAVVYQQPALFPDLTVAENIALALESGGPWRRVNWKARSRAAREALARAGADIDPDARVSSLSMPEQQIVEIAKAIGARSEDGQAQAAHKKILILDEPTASLTDREVDRLFQVIAAVRAEGAGIVYISHRLEEVAAIADRVTVLRDGQTIATCEAKSLSHAQLIRMMVGREIEAIFPKRVVPIGDVALEVRNLNSRAAGIRGVSLQVRAGEILGLSGLVGSGRTQLAETIFGLTPADSGDIFLHGRAVKISKPADAIRHKIGYVPEDRRQHGIVMSMPIAANVTLANLPAVSRHGLVDTQAENAQAVTYVERLQVKTPSIHAEAGSLSGGNQQKVALARWLAIQPKVLILDEPTQGVDVGSKSEIHRLIVDLAEQGLAILMISSELPEILGMSDRIAVMRAGKIEGILTRAEANQENLLALALGHGGPVDNVA